MADDDGQLDCVSESMFDRMDKEGAGTVDSNLIERGIAEMGGTVAEGEAAELVELANPGGDGLLDMVRQMSVPESVCGLTAKSLGQFVWGATGAVSISCAAAVAKRCAA